MMVHSLRINVKRSSIWKTMRLERFRLASPLTPAIKRGLLLQSHLQYLNQTGYEYKKQTLKTDHLTEPELKYEINKWKS